MTALTKITDDGYSVTLNESGNLWIVPADKLTETQIDYIKAHKSEIIAELIAANDQGITETEHAYLTAWLNHIGETDAESIAEFWHNIRHKEGAREYFLSRAYAEATPDYRRHCRQCQNHSPVSGRGVQVIRCTVNKATNNDDLPRHCVDWLDNGLPKPTAGLFERFNAECTR
jgi:hypothetical protein